MATEVAADRPGPVPFGQLLADELGSDAADVIADVCPVGSGAEITYAGRRGDVVFDLRADGSVDSILLDGKGPGFDGYTFVTFEPGDRPDPGLAILLAGYLRDDRASMIDGLSLVLSSRYRPDLHGGLVDLRTGLGVGRPDDGHRTLLSFLNWVARDARAKIVATFDADGNPTSFGAVALDD